LGSDAAHPIVIEAIHLCEPSPQRTPLMYQAGASSRGRQFAATHAEMD
jgi:alkanesulfonate monooxygenase SsuD/methylene tetrahydromethanopterin reductase-like flavin-dependent oxidoreductase (luciferase family)